MKPKWHGVDLSIPTHYFMAKNRDLGKLYLYKYEVKTQLWKELEIGNLMVMGISQKKVRPLDIVDMFPENMSIYKTSNHIFDVCNFAFEKEMFIPFDPKDVKRFMREDLKKRFPGVKYSKIYPDKHE